MRFTHGYESYRGRSRLRTVLMVVIVLLLLVLLLLVAGFYLLQPYVVYTDDGRARLELPFLEDRTPSPAPSLSAGPKDELVVIVTDDPQPSATPTPAAKSGEPLIAVALPRSALTDGTAKSAVEAAGANAAWFDMKGDDGDLGYVSQLQIARDLGSSEADVRLNEGVQALRESGVYTVARVSCFRDNRAPRMMNNSLALRTTGNYNWLDPSDIRWIDPSKEAARTYVIDVCRELAALGFDELVLDWAAYPAEGRLEIISRPAGQTAQQRTSLLEEFYAAVKAALADYPEVKLSIVASPAVAGGQSDESGQTLDMLREYAHHICVPAGDYGAALQSAGIETGRLLLTNPPEGWQLQKEHPAPPTGTGGVLLPGP